MPRSVITANRLQDGAVVWRGAAGCWLQEIDRAASGGDAKAVSAMMAAARADEAAGLVIAPYEVEVAADDASGRLLPVRLRERIRAGGPTLPAG